VRPKRSRLQAHKPLGRLRSAVIQLARLKPCPSSTKADESDLIERRKVAELSLKRVTGWLLRLVLGIGTIGIPA
jgi:hypothetical protein